MPRGSTKPWRAPTELHCTWRGVDPTAAHLATAVALPTHQRSPFEPGPKQMDAGGRSFGAHNLAIHVGDELDAVFARRQQLLSALPGVRSIAWLNQVHGVHCQEITAASMASVGMASAETAEAATIAAGEATNQTDRFTADAAWTRETNLALAVMTADCLPVLLTDRAGSVAAVAHAGWRGLCAGVLPELLRALPVAATELSAFIGPAISAARYEVGEEVAQAFQAAGLGGASVVKIGQGGKFHVDLVQAARQQLRELGVRDISGGHWCTASQDCFYSHRRYRQWVTTTGTTTAAEHTGRQACLVWLPSQHSPISD